MSPYKARKNQARNRFPRVSGDEPAAAALDRSLNGFSPRERG